MMKNKESGQIVLIIVLITIVGLTVGLSLVSRTIRDIRISSQIEQSERAFSAAEAGIETALRGGVGTALPTGTVNLPGAVSDYTVEKLIPELGEAVYFPTIQLNDVQTIWLTDLDSNGNIPDGGLGQNHTEAAKTYHLCWEKSSVNSGTIPALEVSVFYHISGAYKYAKRAYDPDTTSRLAPNNFINADTDASGDNVFDYCGGQYEYMKKITFTGNDAEADKWDLIGGAKLLFLRVQPLYAPTELAFKPKDSDIALHEQGKIITAIGRTETGVVRKIQVNQSYTELPPLLDFTLFYER